MEHHFLPSNPTPHDINVPYVCQPPKEGVYEPYDGGAFLTYPSRLSKEWLLPALDKQGTKTQSFLERRRHFKSTEEQQAIIQSWAFFGLLSVFLGSVYNAADFIEEREGGTFITTKLLTAKMAAAWQARGEHAAPEDRKQQFINAVKCIRVSSDVLQVCREDFDWRIRLSITSVLELFGRSLNEAYNAAWKHGGNPAPAIFVSDFPIKQVGREMLAMGWCPSEVSVMSMRFSSLQSLVFLSRLNKRRWGDARDHSACTDSQCLAYQIDRATYRTVHAKEGCNCAPLPVDMDALCTILDTKALPVLEVSKLDTEAPQVRVVASSEDKPFVALSHVWADGLGNPERNELPTCQVLALGHMVAALLRHIETKPAASSTSTTNGNSSNTSTIEAPPTTKPASALPSNTVHIWIDTICCPIIPNEAKIKSILRMRETYTRAAHVLVLDAALRGLSLAAVHPIEALLCILNCAWVHRLWTLQEGSLPRSLWVQFADAPVELDDLYSNLVVRRLTDVRLMCLVQDAGNVWRGLRRLQHPHLEALDPSLGTTLLSLDQALLHRAVSYAADEPLCIATLLGLPPETALSGTLPVVESRMAVLWRAIANDYRGSDGSGGTGLPQKIILLNYPRLKTPGFRWAPRTLLQAGPGSRILQWKDPTMGTVTEDGFVVRYRAIRLRLEWRRGSALAIASPKRPDLRAGISFHLADERCIIFLNDALGMARSAYDAIPSHDELIGADLAVLLVHRTSEISQDAGVGDSISVLVAVEQPLANPPVVRILCPVVLHGRSDTFDPVYEAADELVARSIAEYDGEKAAEIVASMSLNDQATAAPQADKVEADGDAVTALLERHAADLVRERPDARMALERLHDSSDERVLAELLGLIGAARVRYDVVRSDLTETEEAWCIS